MSTDSDKSDALLQFIADARSAATKVYDSVCSAKKQTEDVVLPYADCTKKTVSTSLVKFHEIRHTDPWKAIGAFSLTCALVSIPWGRYCILRNAGIGGVVGLAAVNPEYVYDLYQNTFKK